MRRLAKLLFYGVFALVWLAMVALGLEVWERWHWQHMMRTNPFVLARQDKGAWPLSAGPDVFSPELLDSAARDRCRGAGQTPAELPVPADRDTEPGRAALFPLLEDWERYTFATVYRFKILLVDGRGVVVKGYSEVNYPGGKTPADFVGEKDLPRVREALAAAASGGPPVFIGDTEDAPWYCAVACPDPGPPGPDDKAAPPYTALLFPNAAAPAPKPEDLWNTDYFSYRPHEKRAAQRNVLGVAERFSTNNVGLRDDDVVLPKPPGVCRVLCIGASTTEEGPDNSLTYPNIVEYLANSKFEGRRVDVINAGISGINSLKHKLKMADYTALQPDIMVVYLAVNDICHDLFKMWVKDAGPWQQRLRESRFIDNQFNAWLLPGSAQMTEDIRRAKMSTLRFIIERARAAGCETVLCTFAAPDPEKLDRVARGYMEVYTQREWGGRYVTFSSYLRALALFNAEIERLGREMNVPVIDVAGKTRGGTEIFGDICHMKNRGIEAKARLIFDGLAPILQDCLQRRGPRP